MVSFRNPTENRISITYNDKVTSEEKIVQTLLSGGVAIEGKQPPAAAAHPAPINYK